MKNSYIIIVFGGLIKKGDNGKWRSGNFNKFRVLAGYYLYKNLSKNHKTTLIASGGNGIYRNMPNVPPVAEVMKQELIRLGLKSGEIIKEPKTLSTYHELVWVKKLLRKNKKIIIISNAYHLPRIEAFINCLPALKELKRTVKLIAAEKIVTKYNKELGLKISKILKSKQVAQIITEEKKGIKALRSGHYKFKE